jgi:hypothetical protein
MNFRLVTLFAALAASPALARATEPVYCKPETFFKSEFRDESNVKAKRLRLFKLGRVTLAGLAVGKSAVEQVQNLARSHSSESASDKYCTWYLHRANLRARQEFNWQYVPLPHPLGQNSLDVAEEYVRSLTDVFARNAVSFVSCAENHGYIALGCHGMQHRGPSVFAMLLAFSGCSPTHSAEIANRLWGLNYLVTARTRLAIAEAGFQLGSEQRESREKLSRLFSEAALEPELDSSAQGILSQH